MGALCPHIIFFIVCIYIIHTEYKGRLYSNLIVKGTDYMEKNYDSLICEMGEIYRHDEEKVFVKILGGKRHDAIQR